MNIEGIDHVHVYVRDLERARRFFSELLGTKFTPPWPVENLKLRASINPWGIELIEPTAADSGVAREMERRGEGLYAISLRVANLDEAVAEMESRGFKPKVRIDIPGVIREADFDPKDSFGVTIELCEYGPLKEATWAESMRIVDEAG